MEDNERGPGQGEVVIVCTRIDHLSLQPGPISVKVIKLFKDESRSMSICNFRTHYISGHTQVSVQAIQMLAIKVQFYG